jgi:hypothetical protein
MILTRKVKKINPFFKYILTKLDIKYENMLKSVKITTKKGKTMKKFFIFIVALHIAVPISLLFPIINLQVGMSGNLEYVDIFRFIGENRYSFVTVLLLVLVGISILGIINSLYGAISKKENKHVPVRNAFIFGFCDAIFGAVFLSIGSYSAFAISAITFILISIFSVKLMKLEK